MKLKGLLTRLRRGKPSDLVMQHVIDAAGELKVKFSGQIEAIETGTTRSSHEKHESTRHISQTLGDRGRLTSVDISPEAIEISKSICAGLANITWIRSDSIAYLQCLHGRRFHLALLDSVNDKDVIFREFELLVPLMIKNGIVIVDDAGVTPDGRSIDDATVGQKGHKIWEFLRSCGATYKVFKTPGGRDTQIRIDLDNDNLAKIERSLASM